MRIALWSFASIFLVLLAGAGAVAYWLYGDYTRITSNSHDVKLATKDLAEPLPQADAPAIALVIGSDHRYSDGSSPSRSDTFMLVRIDPKRHLVSLLSFPRDLWVPIPGFGNDRINAAFSDGAQLQGSSPTKLALETVKNLTGLKINYVAVVDFRGFSDLVNDLHGVYVPVDQYYLHTKATNDASPISDRYSVIDVKPGYQLLRGPDALAFSRYRHTDSDFYRNARQQTFLRAFEQRAASRFHGVSITDLPDIKSLLDTISHNVQIGAHGGPPACARSSSTPRSRHRSPGISCRPGSRRRPGWRARRRWSSPRRMRSTGRCTGSRTPRRWPRRPPSFRRGQAEKPKKRPSPRGRSGVRRALGAERHGQGR